MTQKERVLKARQRLEAALAEVEAAKVELANAFESKFPDGRFFIKRYETRIQWNNQATMPVYEKLDPPRQDYEMWFEVGRFGRNNIGLIKQGDKKVVVCNYRSMSAYDEKITQYTSLGKMLKAAERFKLPTDLVEEFVKRYNDLPV